MYQVIISSKTSRETSHPILCIQCFVDTFVQRSDYGRILFEILTEAVLRVFVGVDRKGFYYFIL